MRKIENDCDSRLDEDSFHGTVWLAGELRRASGFETVTKSERNQMIRSRFGLKALGVCLALAGLMAISVASAQAEPLAKWLIGGVAVTNALKAELQGEFEVDPTTKVREGTLLGTIAGVGIHILCTGFTFATGSQLEIEGKVEGKVLFSGCKISRLKEGKVEPLGGCTPPGGHITTELSKGLLSLHKLASDGVIDTVTVLEPSAGVLFTKINTGEECAFGEAITISGKLAIIDTEVGVSKVSHLIKEFLPLTELYINGNKANKAEIDGSAEVSLSGIPHKGLSWSGDPA